MMKKLLSIVTAFCLEAAAFCAGSGFSFDHMVHDFGDITVNDGPQSCVFTLSNNGTGPLLVLSVVSSCGCTDVVWTREPIPSGGKGEIRATYSNEDGPYPFDKTLSVYLSTSRKPVILHIRGSVHTKKLPLSQTYPVHFGEIGLRSAEYKVGNMDQGQTRSSEFLASNIGNGPHTLAWTDVSPQLVMPEGSVTLDAGSTLRVEYSLKADRTLWGKNYYFATPVVDGVVQEGRVTFWAVTREDVSSYTPEGRKTAPRADFPEGSAEYRIAWPGGTRRTSFSFSNTGKSPLVIYRVQPDNERITVESQPRTVQPGMTSEIVLDADFSGLEKDSENLYLVSVYTNSPFEPVVHLYINAIIL